MKLQSKFLCLAAAALLAAPLAMAQNEGQGQGRATLTLLPSNGNVLVSNVAQNTVSVKVDGKTATITGWQGDRGQNAPVELVLLIDNSARDTLGREMHTMKHFIDTLPPNVKIAVAYMQYGQASLAGPLTTHHDQAANELHLPVGGPGTNASPYFCLSNLAKHWPSNDPHARREVIMISDGVDYYELHYNPEDPYVQQAINDAVKARLVVYSIYWKGQGMLARSWYETNAGQSLLGEVTDATGGYVYWMGMGNPVSLEPYFDNFEMRLKNQYELSFTAPLRGHKGQVENLKVKVSAPDVKLAAPKQVFVTPQG